MHALPIEIWYKIGRLTPALLRVSKVIVKFLCKLASICIHVPRIDHIPIDINRTYDSLGMYRDR